MMHSFAEDKLTTSKGDLYSHCIYVIQECENPATTVDEEYKKFASNYLWVGYKNKGLEYLIILNGYSHLLLRRA
ncbi:hypothetical protein G9F73_005550 [Clostridium estertheticum]|uniref:hypothetical protein n=1 Tax=Clostridium estertheticum TaxID=238834 RepID=UPI001CCDE58C|nr:hypothetical protein [Clostridium estertheticum]MBZ9607290.1 hypothetical protein [Clostridium estertheticum]